MERMKTKAISASAVAPYELEVEFSDGGRCRISLERFAGEGIFKELADLEMFNQVRVDRLGGAEWPNGASLAPEFLIESRSVARAG
jgi:hypothetical protein